MCELYDKMLPNNRVMYHVSMFSLLSTQLAKNNIWAGLAKPTDTVPPPGIKTTQRSRNILSQHQSSETGDRLSLSSIKDPIVAFVYSY